MIWPEGPSKDATSVRETAEASGYHGRGRRGRRAILRCVLRNIELWWQDKNGASTARMYSEKQKFTGTFVKEEDGVLHRRRLF